MLYPKFVQPTRGSHVRSQQPQIHFRPLGRFGRLELVAELLKAHPKGQVLVQGHCSLEGDGTVNAALATQRAELILNYLADKGVPRDRLSFEGFSSQLLLDERAGEDAIRRNRRVDVVVLE